MKKGQRIAQVRSTLRQAEDGMTISQIVAITGVNKVHCWRILRRNMPDAYIDRWTKDAGHYEAVWAVVIPPENCPKPTRKNT